MELLHACCAKKYPWNVYQDILQILYKSLHIQEISVNCLQELLPVFKGVLGGIFPKRSRVIYFEVSSDISVGVCI